MKLQNKNWVALQNATTKELAKIESGNYTLDAPLILLDPYKVSPLTAMVCFTTQEVGCCSVKVAGRVEITHTFGTATTQHLLPIYGLYPDCDNKVTVEFGGTSFEHTIKTAPLPDDMVEIEVVRKSNTNKLTFITDTYTRAFDMYGDVRWYLSKDLVISKDSPVLFLQNGNVAVMNNKLLHHHCYVSGFLELNLLGQIQNEYIVNGVSHEILELNNGDFLVVCEKNDLSTEDYIAIIDRKTGVVKFDYDFKEILNITNEADPCYQYSLFAYKKILDPHLPEKQVLAEVKLKYIYDWLHINSVFYNEYEDYLIISCRIKDCVIKLNSITKEVIWIFTDSDIGWCDEYRSKILKPTNFDRPNYCYAQHSAQISPIGELILFDNGNFRSKDFATATPPNENYSRGVAFKIDENKLTITQTFSFGEELADKLYSCYWGNIQYLNPNNYLINFGGIIYDDEGNFYDAPIVMCHESIRLRTVICEVLDNKEVARYEIPTVNTYRACREDIYSNSDYVSLSKEAQILGTAYPTKTVMLNITLDEMENSELLDYTLNHASDLGERLFFDITFNNCPEDSTKYLVFTSTTREYMMFEFKPDNTLGVNICTLECLGENYKIGLYCYDTPSLFTWLC